MREIEVLYFLPNIVQRHAPFWRNPITGIACCAHAEGGHAAAAPPAKLFSLVLGPISSAEYLSSDQ